MFFACVVPIAGIVFGNQQTGRPAFDSAPGTKPLIQINEL